MAAAVKQLADSLNKLKRKATTTATPQTNKKPKKVSESPRLDSESVADTADIPNFNANVVPANHKPKPGQVLKSFDEVADKQSLVSQAEGFYKKASRICIENGNDWDALARYKTAVCKSDLRRMRRGDVG